MYKNLVLRLLLALMLLPTVLAAREYTPLESFIERVRTTSVFTEVADLWVVNNNFDRRPLLEMVEQVQPMIIDYGKVAAFIKSGHFAISLAVPKINGGTYTIELARYNFFTNDFQVHAKGANGSDGLVGYTQGLYYQGTVQGIPGSLAAFSFFNNEVYGIFSIPGEGNYTLVPNTMTGSYHDYNVNYVLYNDNDLKIKSQAPGCAVDGMPSGPAAEENVSTIVNNKVYNSCTEVRVYEVADYAMFIAKGRSVTKTVNYLTALFNNQNTIYRNEGIPIVLKYIDVDSVTDSYQSISTPNSFLFLTEFGKVTKNNLHGCDVAVLSSTAFGSMGGVAWLRTLCSKYDPSSTSGPYGFCNLDNSSTSPKFPTYSWNVEVMSHEMGHILGSPHTHSCCWNPPGTGTTAIDGCMTLEGSCAIPVPRLPVAGGTVMSYCHLTSKGINFSNGFGQQPGDTVRWFVFRKFSSTCGAVFTPTLTPLATTNRTLKANRECTDMSTTFYWYDNNTADHADDTLVLMIRKNGNDIGSLNTSGFSVGASTISGYGSGTGLPVFFKTGTAGVKGSNYAMHRYWTMQTPSEPKTPVDVLFPFSMTDSSDLAGSTAFKPPVSKYKFYKTNASVTPNPATDSLKYDPGIAIYAIGTAPSTLNWTLSTLGDYNVATMQVSSLSGGGGGIFAYGSLSAPGISSAGAGVYIHPNPTRDQWFVSIPADNGNDVQVVLFTAEGRLLRSQNVSANGGSIDASQLPNGMYFYRIVSESNVYHGNLIKE